MMFYLAQAVSIVTGVVAVVSMQFKSMRKILLGHITANLLSALTYFLLGGFSGAGVCIVAIVQSVVMYLYNLKNVKPPKTVIGIFALLYTLCSIMYFKTFFDVFSAISALCFCISIGQTNPKVAKIWYMFNPLSWLVYDVYSAAYVNIIIHLSIFVSTALSLYRTRRPIA